MRRVKVHGFDTKLHIEYQICSFPRFFLQCRSESRCTTQSRSRKNSGSLASPASTTKPFPCPPPADSRRHRPALSHARRRAHTEPSCAGATARWRSPARFCCAHFPLGFTAQNVATHPSSHAPSTPAPQPSPQRTPGAPLVTIGRPSWRLGPPESRRWPIWAILASNHKRARM